MAWTDRSKPRHGPSSPWRGRWFSRHRQLGVEAGLEVGLAEQRGAVAGLLGQVGGDARRVLGQRDAVGHHAVGAHVLAGEHGRARRHAHRVLVVGPPVVDALGGQAVDDRRAGDRAAVAAEAVVALLVGGDEEDVASHGVDPSQLVFTGNLLSVRLPLHRRIVNQPCGSESPMQVLRTPDDRFDGLDGLLVRTALRRGPRPRRGHPAGPLPRRGSGRRRGRAAAARRAVVVLPLPQDDPGAGRRRATGASPPTWSASAARTSRPAATTTPTPATSSGCARSCSTSLDLHGVTLVVPGLGRPRRPAARRRAPRPLRPRRGRQHLPARRQHARRARRS